MAKQGSLDSFRVRVGSATLVMANADGAWFEPLAAEDVEVEELLLQGIGNGLVEYARGRAVLHGSSVAYGGKGLGIVGPSGLGKSTLCAWLCRERWEFVSDVKIVLEAATRRLIHQQRRWRLRDDSLIELGENPAALPIDDNHTGKRLLRCTDESSNLAEIALEWVVVLRPSDSLDLAELCPMEAVLALVSNSYVAARLEPDPSAHLLQLASKMQMNGLRVFSLSYPHRWAALREVEPILRELLVGK